MSHDEKGSLAEALGLNPKQASMVPALIQREVFFDTLAKHGISPADDNQAEQMIQASERLESKRAEFAKAHDPMSKILRGVLGDQSQPQTQKQAAAPAMIQDISARKELRDEVRVKTAAYLQNPDVYANLLVAFGDQE